MAEYAETREVSIDLSKAGTTVKQGIVASLKV